MILQKCQYSTTIEMLEPYCNRDPSMLLQQRCQYFTTTVMLVGHYSTTIQILVFYYNTQKRCLQAQQQICYYNMDASILLLRRCLQGGNLLQQRSKYSSTIEILVFYYNRDPSILLQYLKEVLVGATIEMLVFYSNREYSTATEMFVGRYSTKIEVVVGTTLEMLVGTIKMLLGILL